MDSQYLILVKSYSHPWVVITLSGKIIKQFRSKVTPVGILKNNAANYCRINGWEYDYD